MNTIGSIMQLLSLLRHKAPPPANYTGTDIDGNQVVMRNGRFTVTSPGGGQIEPGNPTYAGTDIYGNQVNVKNGAITRIPAAAIAPTPQASPNSESLAAVAPGASIPAFQAAMSDVIRPPNVDPSMPLMRAPDVDPRMIIRPRGQTTIGDIMQGMAGGNEVLPQSVPPAREPAAAASPPPVTAPPPAGEATTSTFHGEMPFQVDAQGNTYITLPDQTKHILTPDELANARASGFKAAVKTVPPNTAALPSDGFWTQDAYGNSLFVAKPPSQ